MPPLQAVIVEPLRVEVRSVELAGAGAEPDPGANRVFSAVSAGTELAVYTGTHQWLRDPNLPDWKFPFRPGYSAAGEVVAVGSDVTDGSRATEFAIPATTLHSNC